MHIISAVCFPAQIFILYGLAMEQYTDWTKWNFNGFSQLAFIGGFKLGTYSDLTLTEHFGYSTEVTKNSGIASCIIIGIWIIYGLISTIGFLLKINNENYLKLLMYLRYIIITIQICLLPHISYSAVNAFYNTTLTTQTSAINVCIAIFINIYLLGFMIALFLLARGLNSNDLVALNSEK